MARDESNKNVFDYLKSAKKSVEEAASAAGSLDAWYLPNLPWVYTPRQDNYNEKVLPNRDKAYEEMANALKATVPDGRRAEAEDLYSQTLKQLIDLDKSLKQSSSNSFYYWAPFEVTSGKKDLPMLPDRLDNRQPAPAQKQPAPPNVPALAGNLRFRRGEFDLNGFYNAAQKGYRQADISAAQRLKDLRSKNLMSNLEKNEVSLPAFNDIMEWKFRGETLAKRQVAGRHVAGQPHDLRQLSAIFGPDHVDKTNKIQEQLIKDYAAASTNEAKAKLLSKAAGDIAGVQDKNQDPNRPVNVIKIENERAAAALMGYHEGLADENGRNALQAMEKEMGLLTRDTHGVAKFVNVGIGT